jgi:hypothetical protein
MTLGARIRTTIMSPMTPLFRSAAMDGIMTVTGRLIIRTIRDA